MLRYNFDFWRRWSWKLICIYRHCVDKFEVDLREYWCWHDKLLCRCVKLDVVLQLWFLAEMERHNTIIVKDCEITNYSCMMVMSNTLAELIKKLNCKRIHFSVFKFFHQYANIKFIKFVEIKTAVSKPQSSRISCKAQLNFLIISASVFNIVIFIPCCFCWKCCCCCCRSSIAWNSTIPLSCKFSAVFCQEIPVSFEPGRYLKGSSTNTSLRSTTLWFLF